MTLPDCFATLSPLKRALLAVDELQSRLDAVEHAGREPVAVIGIGCRFPGGVHSTDTFWPLLRDGVSAIREVPAGRWDEAIEAPRLGGFLDDVAAFDAGLFGIAPREAESMDPQQRLLLEVVWAALEDAAQAPDRLSGSRTGLFVGICSSEYADLLKQRDPAERGAHEASGTAHSIASGRVSYLLGLQGPSVSLDTACSSSLVALHLGCQSLRLGETRMAIAAGVGLLVMPDSNAIFAKAGMLASDGRCKTFDASADGYTRSEGCAVVVLKRLRDALADGDRVLGVIRGSAVNQDGASSGLTAPNGPAQEAVIREALANAGVHPRDVTYVEAHGTGTPLGDPIEVQALAAVFGPDRDAAAPLLVGLVKTNVGHMEAAAGLGGLIKVLVAMQHRAVPPHLNFTVPNPLIDWEAMPIVVPTALTAWQPGPGRRRIAGVSAFGFSGTNAHVVVEEPPEVVVEAVATTPGLERPRHVLAVSARTPAALEARLRDLDVRIAADPEGSLADICYTANSGRAHQAQRVAIVTRSASELRTQIAGLLEGDLPAGARRGVVRSSDRPRVAFLFTGQGAQTVGMGAGLYAVQPIYREALDWCAEALNPHLDEDIRRVLTEDQARLDRTAWTQPALFAVEYALAALWRAWGVHPAAVLGHSIGEIAGATVAGVLALEDAARLVARRGQLMDALPDGGAMAAVFADERRVRAALAADRAPLDVAAVNGPANVVISGPAPAVEALLTRLAADGVRTKRLAVSHAFHSALLDPMLGGFEAEAARVAYGRGDIPVISNVTGKPAAAGSWSAAYWRAHARLTVRFADGVRTLYEQGFRVFVECGPHPTLIGLAMQTVDDPDVRWLASLRRGLDDWEQMATAAADAYAAGVAVDWAGFDRGYRRHKVALPTYPFERTRYWVTITEPRHRVPDWRDAHPLLGVRLSSPALSATVFESELSRSRSGYLYDHCVLDQPIMPGAGCLEIGLAAAREIVSSGAPALVDVFLHEPLRLPADCGSLVLQTILRDEHSGARPLEIVGRPAQARPDDSWTVYASARLETGSIAVADEDDTLEVARARCPRLVSADAFYAAMLERGVRFGPAFRGLRDIGVGDHEAVGRLELDAGLLTTANRFVIHPSLLDAAIQVVAAARSVSGAAGEVYLPVGAERCVVESIGAGHLWAHAVLARSDGTTGMFSATVYLYASGGRRLGVLAGLRFRRADPATLRRAETDPVADWMYGIRWVPAASGTLADGEWLEEVKREAAPRIAAMAQRPDLDVYRELLPRLEAASVGYVVRAFASLGCELVGGRRIDAAALAGRIAPARLRLFERLLEILQEEGLLARDGTAWTVVRTPEPSSDAVGARGGVESTSGEFALLDRCGQRLADVLTGACDPLDILFPDASQELVERVYRDSPMAHAMHDLFAAIVRVAASRSGDGPVRVLEVGAGTGSTTAAVLEVLLDGRTEYLFSDISPLFVARARQTFATRRGVHCQVLDIERDVIAQGIDAASFDIIIASDVVHATRDLRETLANLRAALRPGGLLAMLEVTTRQRWVELTFGLTDGWWRFEDRDLRPASPLLDRAQWVALLSEAGFDSAVNLAAGSDDPIATTSVVLARRAPEQVRPTGREWMVFADRSGVGAALVSRLTDRGDAVTVVGGDTAVDVRVACERALAERTRDIGVIYCWGLDGEPGLGDREAQRRLCGGLLAVVQTLARARGPDERRLWVVTSGTQVVSGPEDVQRPDAATLWGVGSVVALEHPNLRCVRVDLEPATDSDVAAAQVLVELGLGGSRGSRRLP